MIENLGRVGVSTYKLLVAGALSAGLVLGSAGVAGAASDTGSNSSLGSSNSSVDVDTEWNLSWAAYQVEAGLGGSSSLLETKDVDLPVTIDAPIDRVFAAYSDLSNSIGRHPFLRDVLDHRTYTDGDAEVWEFIALEDIPAGSATIPGRTVGRQKTYAAEHWYTTDTWDLPGVITHQKVTFAQVGNATVVTEHLSFAAPGFLLDFTAENGVDAHLENQQAMKRDIENGTL